MTFYAVFSSILLIFASNNTTECIMRKNLLLLTLIFCYVPFFGQLNFSFTHYTSDNGLSQNSVTAVLKDSKGYLWFGTRDGLNRFDGYNFTNYNSQFNKKFSGASNRYIDIKEDKFGYIWVKTYDEVVYRLNPVFQQFIKIKSEKDEVINDKINRIFVMPSGAVWLNTIKSGGYKITASPESPDLKVVDYNTANKRIPSDYIESIFEDSQQTTWLLTLGGLVSIDKDGKQTNKFNATAFYSAFEDSKRTIFGSKGKLLIRDKRTNSFKISELPVPFIVSSIHSFSSNFYLLRLRNAGFLTFDVLKNEIKHYSKEKYPEMKTNDIAQVYIDRAGDAWLGIQSSGVVRFASQTNKIEFIQADNTHEKTSNPNILFFEDEKDILWIQPYYGTFSWFDRSKKTLIPFTSLYNNDINIYLRYGVNHVLSDSQGVLWLSTNRGNGIFKCTFLPDYFNHYLLDNKSVYNVSNEIRSIFEDTNKRLWVATKDGNVHVFDVNKKLLGTLDKSGRILPNGKSEMLVYNFFQDKNGNMWLATKQKGLFRLTPTTNKYNFRVENFVHNPTDKYSPVNNDFYSVTQDKWGRIWAGSYGGGLHVIDESNGKVRFIHALNEMKNFPLTNCSKIRYVFFDSKNELWIGTTEGVVFANPENKNPSQIKFLRFHSNVNSNSGMSANDVHYITEDTKKQLWFATFGGGLFRLKSEKNKDKQLEFEHFDRNNGLPNNIIYTITDDQQGNLWLTSENSIVKFNLKNQNFEVFGKGNELVNVEFSEASSCRLSSGEICVGSKSGFYSFIPEQVKRRVIEAPLVFSGLKIYNKDVEIGDESVLEKHIDASEKIAFTHKQNVFTIEFATLDMRAPDKIQYAYMLEGFENEWNRVGAKQSATYTSLPPGKYTFRVKSTDSEGVWINNERTIQIRILPSFWQSIFAKILYVVLVVGLFLLALYIFVTIFKLKNNIQFEKQMTDMKLRFFTDISHELRTPLTLISLPIDNILKENVDPYVHDQISFVRNNLDKVMSLINQILDFRKLQNNKMQLNIEEINFGEFITNCSGNFIEMAHSKNLNLFIDNKSGDAQIWVDPERLESILQNLITNAIKYSPSGKNIIVKTELKADKLLLKVIDEGIGIPQEKIGFIFERFFSNSTLKSILQKSTGIGLDLVKKMVDLHHAEIDVESQAGIGTTFTVSFKSGKLHFDDDFNITTFERKQPVEIVESKDIVLEMDTHENHNPLILIVEDNDELRHYLSMSLKNNYRVAEAANGKKAWTKIEAIQPDIIIADLRMPEMDGMELTKIIRSDNRTSHIPVILLTAVTDLDSKMEGLKIGADDYITKPFNSAFLLARIENLLLQRKKLQQYYRSQISMNESVNQIPLPENHKIENAFITKLMHLMNENIENFDLNIDMLASEFNMSRTIFFTKLKSLTGLSPVEFIREVRLQRAIEIMKTTDLSVSEISYSVGIEDPRYFSRVFKLKFGETPTDYRHKNLKIN